MPLYPKPKPPPVVAAPTPIQAEQVVQLSPVPQKEIAMSEQEAMIPVPQSQLAQMQAQLAELQASNNAARLETEAAKSLAMIKAGQGEAVLKETTARVNEANRRAARYAASSELSRALASHPLGIGAAEQLGTLFADEVVAESTGDSFSVRSKDYKSVPDFVAAKLADPSYAHFLASKPGSPPVNRPAPGNPAIPTTTEPPTTFGEAIVMDAQAKRAADAANAKPATLDMASGMGLPRSKVLTLTDMTRMMTGRGVSLPLTGSPSCAPFPFFITTETIAMSTATLSRKNSTTTDPQEAIVPETVTKPATAAHQFEIVHRNVLLCDSKKLSPFAANT